MAIEGSRKKIIYYGMIYTTSHKLCEYCVGWGSIEKFVILRSRLGNEKVYLLIDFFVSLIINLRCDRMK